MPYIEQSTRSKLGQDPNPITAGELNYLITKMCNNFLVTVNYKNLNEIVGVLECAKLEFYRRAVAAYEDVKLLENGDVYPS